MKQDLSILVVSSLLSVAFVYVFKRQIPEPSAGSRLRSVAMGVRG